MNTAAFLSGHYYELRHAGAERSRVVRATGRSGKERGSFEASVVCDDIGERCVNDVYDDWAVDADWIDVTDKYSTKEKTMETSKRYTINQNGSVEIMSDSSCAKYSITARDADALVKWLLSTPKVDGFMPAIIELEIGCQTFKANELYNFAEEYKAGGWKKPRMVPGQRYRSKRSGIIVLATSYSDEGVFHGTVICSSDPEKPVGTHSASWAIEAFEPNNRIN